MAWKVTCRSLHAATLLLTARSWSRMLPGTFRYPLTLSACSFMVEGTHGSSEPMCLLFLN
eukprot:1160566-Pelagomonas_calceolata.AAC.4